jgi:uncharacterized protein (TIGR03000 family)
LQEVNIVYSVVLMMALTTGGDLQACHHGGGGGCGRHHGGGGCASGGGCGSCGSGGGYAYGGGCSSCGGYAMGGYSAPAYGGYAAPARGGCATCSGGFCTAAADPAGATIVVSLPSDAQLTIDDEATTSTTERRVFVSPTLESGREFHYTLKATVVRDGKPVVMEERVTVRAGEETKVNLTPAATGVAAK